MKELMVFLLIIVFVCVVVLVGYVLALYKVQIEERRERGQGKGV